MRTRGGRRRTATNGGKTWTGWTFPAGRAKPAAWRATDGAARGFGGLDVCSIKCPRGSVDRVSVPPYVLTHSDPAARRARLLAAVGVLVGSLLIWGSLAALNRWVLGFNAWPERDFAQIGRVVMADAPARGDRGSRVTLPELVGAGATFPGADAQTIAQPLSGTPDAGPRTRRVLNTGGVTTPGGSTIDTQQPTTTPHESGSGRFPQAGRAGLLGL